MWVVGVEEVHDLLHVLLRFTELDLTHSRLDHVASRLDLHVLQRAQVDVQLQQEVLVLLVDELLQVLAVGNGRHENVREILTVTPRPTTHPTCTGSGECPHR